MESVRSGGGRVKIGASSGLVEDDADLSGWSVLVEYGSDSDPAIEGKGSGGDDGVGGREQVVAVERNAEGSEAEGGVPLHFLQ